MVNKAVVFVSDEETAEVVQPGERAFDGEPTAVTPELAAVLALRAFASASTKAQARFRTRTQRWPPNEKSPRFLSEARAFLHRTARLAPGPESEFSGWA